jgi:hypothetical protein
VAGDCGKLPNTRWIYEYIAWRTQPEKLVTGVTGHVTRCADTCEDELACIAHACNDLIKGHRRQLCAQMDQGVDGCLHNLEGRIGRRIFGAHIAMHETVRTTHRFGQAKSQLAKAAQTHTAAKTDD